MDDVIGNGMTSLLEQGDVIYLFGGCLSANVIKSQQSAK